MSPSFLRLFPRRPPSLLRTLVVHVRPTLYDRTRLQQPLIFFPILNSLSRVETSTQVDERPNKNFELLASAKPQTPSCLATSTLYPSKVRSGYHSTRLVPRQDRLTRRITSRRTVSRRRIPAVLSSPHTLAYNCAETAPQTRLSGLRARRTVDRKSARRGSGSQPFVAHAPAFRHYRPLSPPYLSPFTIPRPQT